MKQPDIVMRVYATLLDAFTDYINSETIWEKYYGSSAEPKYSLEEFKQKQEADLIRRINREPFSSYAADQGTVFNELVDACIEGRKPNEDMEVCRVFTSKEIDIFRLQSGMVKREPKIQQYAEPHYLVNWKKQVFDFPVSLVSKFFHYYGKDALTQQRVSAVVDTMFGKVEVYGVIDELKPLSVHDIKTTGKYEPFKFKNHWQHIVYPYCLQALGNDISTFEYNVTDFSEIYTETYVFDKGRDLPKLQNILEQFFAFIDCNREKITDKKIFNELDE